MVLPVSNMINRLYGEHVRSVSLPSPEGVVLGLKVVSVEHRVVGLFSTWADHVESSSNFGSLLDLVC